MNILIGILCILLAEFIFCFLLATVAEACHHGTKADFWEVLRGAIVFFIIILVIDLIIVLLRFGVVTLLH
jgi:hypothetical protein